MTVYEPDIINLILPRLVDADFTLPENNVDAVYILGGSQNSLVQKFQTAHDICKNRDCRKILVLSRPGITEYSRSAGKNLNNDEWALSRMEAIGVPGEKIRFIKMEDGFFGTYNEAKHVSQIILEKSYKSVTLISSAYHTKRVRISFNKFLKGHPVKVYVMGSKEMGSVTDLLVEFTKLTFYQLLLT